jgi:hypothetical protein
MEKSKTHYWAVFHKKEILFSGTFTQCWNHFVKMAGDEKVSKVIAGGYHIARKS